MLAQPTQAARDIYAKYFEVDGKAASKVDQRSRVRIIQKNYRGDRSNCNPTMEIGATSNGELDSAYLCKSALLRPPAMCVHLHGPLPLFLGTLFLNWDL